MTATGKKNESTPAPAAAWTTRLVRWLFGRGRRVTLLAILVAAFAVLWRQAWREARERVLDSREYQLRQESLEITPPPAWVRGDIKREVFRDGSLDASRSLLDPQLAETIARAFALHPWVARVTEVRKRYPATIEVRLIYRKIAAVVRLGERRFPVDEAGTLLPREDFADAELDAWPLIAGIDTEPAGPVGTPWGDERVAGGAAIAAELGTETWNKHRFSLIEVPPRPPRGANQIDATFRLRTAKGTRITWGRPPGARRPEEMPAEKKLACLAAYAEQHGSLDGHAGHDLDLSMGEAPRRVLRPEINPLPDPDASGETPGKNR